MGNAAWKISVEGREQIIDRTNRSLLVIICHVAQKKLHQAIERAIFLFGNMAQFVPQFGLKANGPADFAFVRHLPKVTPYSDVHQPNSDGKPSKIVHLRRFMSRN